MRTYKIYSITNTRIIKVCGRSTKIHNIIVERMPQDRRRLVFFLISYYLSWFLLLFSQGIVEIFRANLMSTVWALYSLLRHNDNVQYTINVKIIAPLTVLCRYLVYHPILCRTVHYNLPQTTRVTQIRGIRFVEHKISCSKRLISSR